MPAKLTVVYKIKTRNFTHELRLRYIFAILNLRCTAIVSCVISVRILRFDFRR
jgi:hypothetical protein